MKYFVNKKCQRITMLLRQPLILSPPIQVPYSSLDQRTAARLMPHVSPLYRLSAPYHVTGSYGLFRHMTGVGGRPELQLEGAESLGGPWIEYQFAYKPGAVDMRPPVVGEWGGGVDSQYEAS